MSEEPQVKAEANSVQEETPATEVASEDAAPAKVESTPAVAIAPAEEQPGAEAEEPATKRRPVWAIVVAVVVAILALCICAICMATSFGILAGGKEEAPPPAATEGAVPTMAPSGAMIAITDPVQGANVDISQPVAVKGKGAGLPEGNVIVQVLDAQGNQLAQQPTTLQGEDVDTGGGGTWAVELMIEAEPGTAGKIRAYSLSPKDDSIVAEDVVEVSLGQTAAKPAYIQIQTPQNGENVDISQPVTVAGTGGGLPEGNVVVQVLDAQGNQLAQQPTTLQGQDVGSGGEGTWSVELMIETEPGAAGRIHAFSPSSKDGGIVAEDAVEVSLGQTAAAESFIRISEPAPGSTLDVSQLVQVSGSGAGLPEGNVVVVAVDANGDLMAEQSTTLEGADVGTGGEGTWSVELAVEAAGQTPGYIAAFSASPKQRDLVASDHIEVVFAGELTLEGTTWLLDKTMPETEITAKFGDGRVSGSAGCNDYTGPYRTTTAAGKNTMEIGPLATTRMMCDEAVMEQEQLYLSALDSATEYILEGFALSITYPGGSLLFYDKDGPQPR